MTDELITTLAKISALRVISRTSVAQYKETKKSIAQIAQELKVDAVLEGTVMREQDRVRITVQLIRSMPERHLWAESYEAPLVGILKLQSDVARAIARAIRIKVTEQEQAQLTPTRNVSPSAYDAFLKGRHLWEFKGEGNLIKSREFLERSIAEDPGYAKAWAALADTYNYLSNWGVAPRQDTAPRARAAAEKALELDNSLITPLVALADVKTGYEWDWAGAERLLRQAIESSPNYGDAHHSYATYLAAAGRTEEALAEARKAYEVEPLNLEYAANVPWKLYALHRYDEAELELRRLKDWWPRFNGTYVLASIYLQTGRPQESVSLAQQSAEDSHRAVIELAFLGRILGVSGARSEGRKILGEMQQRSQRRYVPPEQIAMVYEGLGERDHAIQWFEKAYTERSINIWFLPDPALDSIRSDPRFKKILQRMGLPQ
jgi:tetratricopeptide (TPR) repeat protein